MNNTMDSAPSISSDNSTPSIPSDERGATEFETPTNGVNVPGEPPAASSVPQTEPPSFADEPSVAEESNVPGEPPAASSEPQTEPLPSAEGFSTSADETPTDESPTSSLPNESTTTEPLPDESVTNESLPDDLAADEPLSNDSPDKPLSNDSPDEPLPDESSVTSLASEEETNAIIDDDDDDDDDDDNPLKPIDLPTANEDDDEDDIPIPTPAQSPEPEPESASPAPSSTSFVDTLQDLNPFASTTPSDANEVPTPPQEEAINTEPVDIDTDDEDTPPPPVSVLTELQRRLQPEYNRTYESVANDMPRQQVLARKRMELTSRPAGDTERVEFELMEGLMYKLGLDTERKQQLKQEDGDSNETNENSEDTSDREQEEGSESDTKTSTTPPTFEQLRDELKAHPIERVTTYDLDNDNNDSTDNADADAESNPNPKDIFLEPRPHLDTVYNNTSNAATSTEPTYGILFDRGNEYTVYHTSNLMQFVDPRQSTTKQLQRLVQHLRFLAEEVPKVAASTKLLPDYESIYVCRKDGVMHLFVKQAYVAGRNLARLNAMDRSGTDSGTESGYDSDTPYVPFNPSVFEEQMNTLMKTLQDNHIELTTHLDQQDFKVHFVNDSITDVDHFTCIHPGKLRSTKARQERVLTAAKDVIRATQKTTQHALLPLVALAMSQDSPLDTMQIEPVRVVQKVPDEAREAAADQEVEQAHQQQENAEEQAAEAQEEAASAKEEAAEAHQEAEEAKQELNAVQQELDQVKSDLSESSESSDISEPSESPGMADTMTTEPSMDKDDKDTDDKDDTATPQETPVTNVGSETGIVPDSESDAEPVVEPEQPISESTTQPTISSESEASETETTLPDSLSMREPSSPSEPEAALPDSGAPLMAPEPSEPSNEPKETMDDVQAAREDATEARAELDQAQQDLTRAQSEVEEAEQDVQEADETLRRTEEEHTDKTVEDEPVRPPDQDTDQDTRSDNLDMPSEPEPLLSDSVYRDNEEDDMITVTRDTARRRVQETNRQNNLRDADHVLNTPPPPSSPHTRRRSNSHTHHTSNKPTQKHKKRRRSTSQDPRVRSSVHTKKRHDPSNVSSNNQKKTIKQIIEKARRGLSKEITNR